MVSAMSGFSSQVRHYARDTFVVQDFPFGWYVTAKVMCSDGRLRKVKRIATTADTFFSVPAAVTVKGKTVAGYMTIECESGSSVKTDDDPAIAKFIAYEYGKNHALLPDGAWCRESEDAARREADRARGQRVGEQIRNDPNRRHPW